MTISQALSMHARASPPVLASHDAYVLKGRRRFETAALLK